ncbi:motility protein A [Acetanaerobacterium elongatum]|uniref:Chemotaxis protein MotA n=1 Tax=Acetanaerobacterium elongatum TaxID=258515 RepID=A0A1G9ZF61_9FIRM|nr:motility protein A [Acetanaerobacterium elongatum]SDN20052.1 chemotaxis protein MotA [Acetanaerobacterium elongatum]
MDLMSLIGFILAFVLVIFGMVFNMPKNGDPVVFAEMFKFGSVFTFVDYPSMAITIGGTIATLMISFPVKAFKKILPHLKIIFFPRKYNPNEQITRIVELAKAARSKGLLALEDELNEKDDDYLRNGIMMIVDAIDPEKVKSLLEEELDFLDERHGQDRAFYEKGATFAPAFGMIGTLIGLILMLKKMDDATQLGNGMSVALITTFYGSMLCNILFIPISAKLKVRHEEEYLCKLIICEGVQAIQAGENPRFIAEKLYRLLPSSIAKKNASSKGEDETGAEKDKKASKGPKK